MEESSHQSDPLGRIEGKTMKNVKLTQMTRAAG